MFVTGKYKDFKEYMEDNYFGDIKNRLGSFIVKNKDAFENDDFYKITWIEQDEIEYTVSGVTFKDLGDDWIEIRTTVDADVHFQGYTRGGADSDYDTKHYNVCNRGNLISKATGGHFSCSPELVEILSSANSVADFKTIVKEHGGLEGIDITDRGYFTGFPDIADRNSIQAFTQLASRMNSISMEQGTVRMKQADAENEKFSFRIWLLGLGMKGEEYKTARRILLAPLKGNTAFRTDEIRESFRARQKAKRESERRRS